MSASVSVAVPAYDWVANPTQAAIYGSITGYNAGNTAPISIYASDRIIATEFNAYSDARIKNIIGTINTADSLQFVANINPIHYQIKNHIDDGDKFGFIAQDLIKLGFGNMVGHVPDSELEETTDSDGFTSPAGIKLTVDYIQVIPLLTSAIKELNNQIQELKSQVSALTSK